LSKLGPALRVLGPALGLTIVQIVLLYLLYAINFFENFKTVYGLYSYPFRVVYGIVVFLASATMSQEGATQILHSERVFMRIFFVAFTLYLIYFAASKMKALEKMDNWKRIEGVLEIVGIAVAFTFIQIAALYFLHTIQLFEGFKAVYNTLFFPFDYAYGAVRFLAGGILGQNEYIQILKTDIFKRIFFVMLSVNITGIALSNFLGAKYEDS